MLCVCRLGYKYPPRVRCTKSIILSPLYIHHACHPAHGHLEPQGKLSFLSHCQRALNHQAYEKSASYVPQLAAKLQQWLDPLPTDRILDVGCGDGKLTAIFAQAAQHVIGLDASPMMIEAAQREFGSPCAEFHVVDCRHLA